LKIVWKILEYSLLLSLLLTGSLHQIHPGRQLLTGFFFKQPCHFSVGTVHREGWAIHGLLTWGRNWNFGVEKLMKESSGCWMPLIGIGYLPVMSRSALFVRWQKHNNKPSFSAWLE
jgi:hypothetical protein